MKLFTIEHIHRWENTHYPDRGLLVEIFKELKLLNQQNVKIMANQQELAAQINEISGTITKIKGETQTTLDKVQELQDVINNQGGVSAELQAAVDNLKAQVQVVDELIPDAPPPVEGEPQG
jgi:seryl-tRNA synthetase